MDTTEGTDDKTSDCRSKVTYTSVYGDVSIIL